METHCLVLLVLSQGCCGQGKHFFKVRENIFLRSGKSHGVFFFYQARKKINSTSQSLSKHSFSSKSTMAEKRSCHWNSDDRSNHLTTVLPHMKKPYKDHWASVYYLSLPSLHNQSWLLDRIFPSFQPPVLFVMPVHKWVKDKSPLKKRKQYAFKFKMIKIRVDFHCCVSFTCVRGRI